MKEPRDIAIGLLRIVYDNNQLFDRADEPAAASILDSLQDTILKITGVETKLELMRSKLKARGVQNPDLHPAIDNVAYRLEHLMRLPLVKFMCTAPHVIDWLFDYAKIETTKLFDAKKARPEPAVPHIEAA